MNLENIKIIFVGVVEVLFATTILVFAIYGIYGIYSFF